MHDLQYLVGLAGKESYPEEAIEGVKVVLLHDLAVALSARPLVGALLEPPYGAGKATDLATGRPINMPAAVSRNGQLMHALTQDDTHLPAMTHVGATTIPLLLALGETEGARLADLLAGLAAAYAAAEYLGLPTSAALAAKGIRPTPVIGPLAAVVAAGRMLHWEAERVRRAVGRAGTVAFGTTQAWIDGSHEWLFEISAAGLVALSAARTSALPWRVGQDPLWGDAGLFRCLGLAPRAPEQAPDHATAVLRANVKRFPACAINQVPLVLVRQAMDAQALPEDAQIRLQLSPPEARYPGVARQSGLESWSGRLMSLPYCVAVLRHSRDFVVRDLEEAPAGMAADSAERIEVVANDRLKVGTYEVEIVEKEQTTRVLKGSLDDVGRPRREELRHAATTALGTDRVAGLLAVLDDEAAAVGDLTARLFA